MTSAHTLSTQKVSYDLRTHTKHTNTLSTPTLECEITYDLRPQNFVCTHFKPFAVDIEKKMYDLRFSEVTRASEVIALVCNPTSEVISLYLQTLDDMTSVHTKHVAPIFPLQGRIHSYKVY